jgi:hypothetical protein
MGEKSYARRQARRKSNTAFVQGYLATHPCLYCGSWGDDREFHHRDRAKKTTTVSNLRLNYTMKRLKAEIAKCDVVCKSCHIDFHRRLDNKPIPLPARSATTKILSESGGTPIADESSSHAPGYVDDRST